MQKRHHFVPRCYLENFTDDKGFVWVLDTKDKIFNIKPENILVENHFYRITLKDGTKSLVIENTLSEIESLYATIYRDKISKELPLTTDEKAHVSVFVSAMMHRTKSWRESTKAMFADLKETLKEWDTTRTNMTEEQRRALHTIPSDGKSISLKEIEEGLSNFDEHHSTGLIDNSINTAQYIFNMNWAIWSTQGKTNFVTSDSPLVVDRPAAIKKYGRDTFGSRPGLKYKDAEVTLPLSNNQLLLAGWILEKNSYISVPEKWVEGMNQRTILNSSERLIANSSTRLEKIKLDYPSKK